MTLFSFLYFVASHTAHVNYIYSILLGVIYVLNMLPLIFFSVSFEKEKVVKRSDFV